MLFFQQLVSDGERLNSDLSSILFLFFLMESYFNQLPPKTSWKWEKLVGRGKKMKEGYFGVFRKIRKKLVEYFLPKLTPLQRKLKLRLSI